jgi:predicted secreted acid phosphatase
VNNTVSARSFLFILGYAGKCRFVLAILSIVGLLLAQQCCAGMSPSGTHGEFITVLSQPANIGDTKIAALAYHQSGAYERDLNTVVARAGQQLALRASAVKRAAIVFDVDETVLSNWEIINRDDFGRPIEGPCNISLSGPCGWAAWDQLAQDPPIVPSLKLFRQARSLDVTIFFISGRPENQRAATERNLQSVGYRGYARLYMVPNGTQLHSLADFKAPDPSED